MANGEVQNKEHFVHNLLLLTVNIKNVPMAFIMTFGPPIGSEKGSHLDLVITEI